MQSVIKSVIIHCNVKLGGGVTGPLPPPVHVLPGEVTHYTSRRSRTRDTVKLSVCLSVCVSVPTVTAQRLHCDEN